MSAKLAFVLRRYLLFSLCLLPITPAQQPSVALKASAVEHTKEGDQPDNPGPIATDLSSKLTSPAIRAAMKKVGRSEEHTSELQSPSVISYAV